MEIEFVNEDTVHMVHCYHVNDFPLVNGTPGIIQDPIDHLLAKCNLPIKRSTVLVFNAGNTVDLLMGKLHFANKRSTVLVFNACNTVDLLMGKLHFANKRSTVLVFNA